MKNVIKLRKGLDINLKGTACKGTISTLKSGEYALVPESFCGVIPKVVVHEGDKVKAGEALFVSKKYPEVKLKEFIWVYGCALPSNAIPRHKLHLFPSTVARPMC